MACGWQWSRSCSSWNLCGVYYWLARVLFLRDTGRKLRHLDRQLGTADGVIDELRHQVKQ